MDLIKTFLYFAIFKHPLTKEEAKNFCQYKTDNIDDDLALLLEKKILYKIDDYYLPYNEPSWVKRRKKGNKLAKETLGKARKMGAILSKFPFVRSVMISGSLSKGYMDEFSDIDFFVIMKPGNITISKLFMGIFERIFAKGNFCVNFLIDSDHLYIKKQNLYTAIELTTLVPIWDSNLFNSFIETNKNWVLEYLPNYKQQTTVPKAMKHGRGKRITEKLLSLYLANYLNKKLIQFYQKRWEKRNKNYDANNKASGELEIKKGILKFHTSSAQTKILKFYETHQENLANQGMPRVKEYFYD